MKRLKNKIFPLEPEIWFDRGIECKVFIADHERIFPDEVLEFKKYFPAPMLQIFQGKRNGYSFKISALSQGLGIGWTSFNSNEFSECNFPDRNKTWQAILPFLRNRPADKLFNFFYFPIMLSSCFPAGVDSWRILNNPIKYEDVSAKSAQQKTVDKVVLMTRKSLSRAKRHA